MWTATSDESANTKRAQVLVHLPDGPQTRRLIGMARNEHEIEPRQAEQEPAPQDVPPHPEPDDKLEDGHADQQVPPSRRRTHLAGRTRYELPLRHLARELHPEEYDAEHHGDPHDDRHDPGRAPRVEPLDVPSEHGHFGLCDDAGLHEILKEIADLPPDDAISANQYGHRDEETHVDCPIEQRRDRDSVSRRNRTRRRQDHERHPREQQERQDPMFLRHRVES